jgi:quercetin dioxygenase-like cupin family protein
MKLVHADEVAPRRVSGHRTGDISFQRLLQGDPEALDNHELSLVRNAGKYHTPRHRHNFEQFRMILEGEFSWATRRRMKTGQVGYFPEGTPYGPQNVTDCLTLVLQCGGPSGQGFLSYDQLHDGHQELSKLGTFEDGVFRRAAGANAPPPRKNQDGYEAIWEHVRGRKLTYPARRYEEPVIMTPDAIAWEPTAREGVERKLLGAFDHGARAELFRLELGAGLTIEAPNAVQLLFVLEGAGRVDGRVFRRRSAIGLARGERAAIEADAPTEILRLGVAAVRARAFALLERAA